MTKPRHLTDRELYNNVGLKIRLQKILCSRGACTFAHRAQAPIIRPGYRYAMRISYNNLERGTCVTCEGNHYSLDTEREDCGIFWGPICLSYVSPKNT
jgi:hypothetical protein